ncbi:TIGR03943 family putative permease subunit [Streptomyces sp. NPDC059786]|uniref:TIGR03943 family putative permease subunit n=1 Tax=Streptomyces sp. NPDC059786 TaxID=3346946 RepID=UPI0036614322
MRRYGPALLLLLSGAAVLRVSLFSDLYLRYVQQGLRPYLIASGVLLAALGAVSAVRTRAPERHDEGDNGDDDDGHGHEHGRTPRIAWLLAVPAAVLLLFPPPALGTYSAEREAAERAAQGVGTFPALAAGDPVDLTLGEFTSRAIYDENRSLKGRTVRLTGFVVRGSDGTWYLARLRITCCAADASTYKVRIEGADAPEDGQWVTLTGTWRPHGALGSDEAWPPVLDAASLTRVKQPANPYERR